MSVRRLLTAIALVAALMLARTWPALGATFPPRYTWQTVDTPHFRVHFHEGWEDVARLAASKLEAIHAVLTEEVGWTPRLRTDVAIVDHTDFANGYASTIPTNAIVIFATAPIEGASLDFYDQWLSAILIHEYTHILHIDTIEGPPVLARRLFGRLVMTNDVWPRWVVEGYAVYEESRQTNRGRARSTNTDMLLRLQLLEEGPIPLGNAEGFQRAYPGGSIRYLWGGRFWTWVAEEYGPEAITQFMHRHARAVNPLGFTFHAIDVFGESIYALWDRWQAELLAQYKETEARLKAAGIVEGSILVGAPGQIGGHTFSPDGETIYFSQGADVNASGIFSMPAAGGAPKRLLRDRAPRTLDVSPDGSTLYFSTPAEFDQYFSFMDVFAYRLDADRLTRLSHRARARDPVMDAQGERLLTIYNEHLSTGIAQLLPGGATRVIRPAEGFTQLGAPAISPDGQTLAVSMWMEGGQRDLYLLDAQGQILEQLTDDWASDIDPAFSADGRTLYFASDRTGISNIYALDLESRVLSQVTRVVGGAADPTPSPDGRRLLYTGYSARGADLRMMALDPAYFFAPDAAIPAPAEGSAPALAGDALPGEAPPESWGAPRPYRPWPTLFPPRLLAPDLFISESGYAVLGAYTFADDPLAQHSYRAWANYRTDSRFVSYGLSYTLNRFHPVLSLSASTQAVYLGPLLGYPIPTDPGPTFQGYYPRDYTYFEVRTRASAQVSVPLQGPKAAWVRFDAECREPLNPVPGVDEVGWDANPLNCPDPVRASPPGYFEAGIPDRGSFTGLTFGWRYRRTRGYPQSISPEDGQGVTLTAQVQTRLLGADYERQVFTADWRGYVGIPELPRLGLHNHVLALRAAAGAGLGDRLGQSSFRLGGTFGTSPFVVIPPEFFSLRGYGVGSDTGDRFFLGSAEYRLPLFYLDRGIGMLPLFLQGASLALFSDLGNAFDPVGLEQGVLDPGLLMALLQGVRVGTGAEVKVDALIGYGMGFSARLGWALGWQGGYPGDLRSLYLQLGSSF